MDQIVSQIFAPFVNIATDLIKTHLGYATCSTKHVNNMRNKMKILEDASTDVKKHMDTNKINDKEIPTGVPDWLNDVEDLKKKVESISSDDIGCLDMKMRYRAGRNAFKATKTIEELITKKSGFSWTDVSIPTGRVNPQPTSFTTSTPPPSSSSSYEDGFKSRDMPFNNALKFLQQDDNKSQLIALCGMGGVGKTTMMEQLKDHKNVKTMFHYIVKVAIGRNPNMYSIQNDIALSLGGEGLHEETITARADCLCKKFKNTLEDDRKKILVILDDVWNKIKLQDIGLTSPLLKGVKLLLTSRDSNICQQIAVDACLALQEVKVDVLKEAEANNFFSRITEVSEEDDHEKYLIGCDIVKKCGYLPLAIKLIASVLKSKEDYVWRNIRNRLKNNDDIEKVQEVIKISYEHIEDDEHKDIFLHCGMFPEDYDIPIEDLRRHAWGLQLLKNISSLREARDRVNTCVSNLINANLLTRSDYVGCVKMHDLVLAFVLGRVSKGDHAWVINHGDVSKWGRDETRESCKRISLTCKGLSQFPRDFKYQNLSLLQLMHGDKSLTFPEDFYENMEKLQVIAYFKMWYPQLPRSLQCSTNLKSLCLHECQLMYDFSFVGDLMNLEVLSLSHCGIRKLPSTIGNLEKLKLIDLTGCIDLHIDDGVFQKLVSLEELYMKTSGKNPIRFTDSNWEELKMLSRQLVALEVELIAKKTLTLSFKKLNKFEISVGCNLEEEYRNKKYSSRNTLKLVTDCNELFDCKINELFKKTEKLHLQVKGMICLEAGPYNQHSFSNLRDLVVCDCADLKYLFPISIASGLKKLVRLKISSCCILEALVQNDGSEINSVGEIIKFEKLKFLSLENLPKLARLFCVELAVVELPQLVELAVVGLPNFTSIYSDKNLVTCALLNTQVKIPKLKKLKVWEMRELKQIWGSSSSSSTSEEEMNYISTLRMIELVRCDSLENIFPINPMRFLNQLERLAVRKCGSIEVIFNIDLECVGHEVGKSSLRSIQVEELDSVREVWRIKGGPKTTSIIHGFEAVERIVISRCKRFRNVFTPTKAYIKFDTKALTFINWPSNSEAKVGRKEGDINNISSVAFPSNLYMDAFHYLRTISMGCYYGVEVVFEMDSPSSGELITTSTTNNQQTPPLPNLRELHLYQMDDMSHVWKWNKFLILQNQSSFHNLTTIHIWFCHRIKYLFSPLMAKLLFNLKTIEIENCDGMEEVVSNRDDDKDEEMTTSTTTDFFHHLQLIHLYKMRNLERIGGGGGGAKGKTNVIHDQLKFPQVSILPWSLCQYSVEIRIYSCHGLSSVVPSNVAGQMQKLQVLAMNDCKSLTEVFETQKTNNNIDEGNVNVPQLSNLKKLVITCCDLLQHVFTFSTLESLGKLEELMIKNCKDMKVIVKEENGEQRKVVDFPCLKSLELEDLPKLEGFFLGMNDFNWPLLEFVKISKCPQIMKFTSGKSTAPVLKDIHTSLGKHCLEECGLNFHLKTNQSSSVSTSLCSTIEPLPWSFHNLIEIDMEFCNDEAVKKIIPFEELLHLQKLERIRLYCCSNVEEVIEMEGTNSESHTHTHVVEIPNLTQLELTFLENLKYIWKSNHRGRTTVLKFSNLTTLSIGYCNSLKHILTSSMVGSLLQLQHLHISCCSNMEVIVNVEEEEDQEEEEESKSKSEGTTNSESHTHVVEIPNLTQLELTSLESLKYIWKSNHHGRTTVLKFSNLTTLSINNCQGLKHVFTSSMVGSLLQLQHLHINFCPNMEVIVKVEEEYEFKCDGKVKEMVMLPCLKSLKLEILKSLKGFCLGKVDFTFPSLHNLEIKECLAITVFTEGHLATQALHIIDTGFGRCYIGEDLNSFIKSKRDEGFQF